VSVVTNVMLSLGALEDELLIQQLNRQAQALRPEGVRALAYYDLRSLTQVDPHSEWCPSDFWGGSKVPECTVYAGAFNHLKVVAYVRLVRDLLWEYPEHVQLFVKLSADDRWRVVTVAQLRGMDLEAFLREGQ